MSEFERYTPPEAQPEAKAETLEKPNLRAETISHIQKGPPETPVSPPAAGERIHWISPEGNVVGPEQAEIYRSTETLSEKEPGFGPKASHSDDPGKTVTDDQTASDNTTAVQDNR